MFCVGAHLRSILDIMKREKAHINGSCLCGAVRFGIRGVPLSFRYCTCRSCQKTTGSVHASNLTIPLDRLEWVKGEEHIRTFVEEKDNPGFPTAFCSICGSFLPHVSRSGTVFVVPAGLIDGEVPLDPEEVIFWDECPNWYRSVDGMRRHGGPVS